MSSEGLSGILGLANFNPERGGVSTAIYGSDKGLIVEFYMRRVKQEFESEKQGREIWKDIPTIHLFTPGAKSDNHRDVKLVTDQWGPSDLERFPRQWQAFQNQQEQAQEGMPLEEWARLSRAEVMEWKACKIHTVEQLAALADVAASGMPMNWRKTREKAQAWLASITGDQAKISSVMAENDTLKADVEMLKTQIAELAAQQTKRGPGRPRKEEGESNGD